MHTYKETREGKNIEILPKFRGKLISDKEFNSITDAQKRPFESYKKNQQLPS
jgi:hypothetical protein